jgi:thymidylate kinase
MDLVRDLFEKLNAAGIRYCHWKCNFKLQEAIDGMSDVNLLVEHSGAARFESIISELGFEPVMRVGWQEHPYVSHHSGLDSGNSRIVHLHVSTRIVIGGILVKPYGLPLERLLLENTGFFGPICIPNKPAELVVFVIEKMLECSSPLESLFVARDLRQTREELEWLLEGESLSQACALLQRSLPFLRRHTFENSVRALARRGALAGRFLWALRVKYELRHYLLGAPLWREFNSAQRLFRWIALRALDRQSKAFLLRGGALIAVVGPDGSGKSTVVAELYRWLGEHFTAVNIHAGKSPSTVWTFLPDRLAPMLRLLLPRYRTHQIKNELEKTDHGQLGKLRLLVFGLRSVMVAFNRRRLLARALRLASRGTLVISDRYPTTTVGLVDSPQLDLAHLNKSGLLIRLLARLERKLYQQIPPPDIAVRLHVPLELVVERNATRHQKAREPEKYVRERHNRWVAPDFQGTRLLDLNGQQELMATLHAAKQGVWNSLQTSGRALKASQTQSPYHSGWPSRNTWNH